MILSKLAKRLSFKKSRENFRSNPSPFKTYRVRNGFTKAEKDVCFLKPMMKLLWMFVILKMVDGGQMVEFDTSDTS